MLISIRLTPESQAVIQEHAKRPDRLTRALGKALGQGLQEAETHVKVKYLSGRYDGRPRGGSTPVALRSGALRQSVTSKRDEQLSGFVGVARGPASRYAAVILGSGKTTITPKRGKYLAIPIADGLTAGGQPRFPGGPRSVKGLRIFRSKAGNLVGFLPTGGLVKRGSFKRGTRKGQAKGKLLFVFKESVTVTGTDALAKGVSDKRARIGELLEDAAHAAISGEVGA